MLQHGNVEKTEEREPQGNHPQWRLWLINNWRIFWVAW